MGREAQHGTYTLDFSEEGIGPLDVYCYFSNGRQGQRIGWTMCGKFDGQGLNFLQHGWGRSFVNADDMGTIDSFSGTQASIDCRILIRRGMNYVLHFGSDDGTLDDVPCGTLWQDNCDDNGDIAMVNNLTSDILADPTNLWDVINTDNNIGDDGTSCEC